MNGSMIGSKAFVDTINFKNGETSASIPVGSPVCFVMDGTEDGFRANLPATAAAAKCPTLVAGVNVSSQAVVAGDFGTAAIWGFCNYALVVQQSRTASTDSYVSAAALSVGQPLSIDTVNNAFAVVAAQTVVTAATSNGTASNIAFATATLAYGGNFGLPGAVMAQTLAVGASSASTSSDSSLKKTFGVKVFLRSL